MKIDIPPIVRTLSLAEYAPEMEVNLSVWINPPRAILQQYYSAALEISEALNGKTAGAVEAIEHAGAMVIGVLTEIWSRGPEDTRWSVADIIALQNNCMETDPALWSWMVSRTMEMIAEHRAQSKKK